jgi:HEAT repeat protein
MFRFALALLMTALSAPALAGPLRSQVEAQLDGIESPPDAISLRALGEGVSAELIEIAQDAEASRTRRAKALHALGWFPSAATRAVLEGALDGGDPKMARRAVYALGNGWGDQAVPAIERALADNDVQLRIAAAASLGNIGTPLARSALDARLKVEVEPTVRHTLQASLGGRVTTPGHAE